MRSLLTLLFCLCVGAVVPARAASDIDFGRYHALVIGINDYEHLTDLETAVNDASAVHDVLRRQYGFDSTLLLNPDRYKLVSTLNKLRAELEEDVNLLIYYAGHGYLDKETGEGFWLPTDAEEDSDANWLAVSTLTRTLKAVAAKHVLVVADSCYSGTLTRAAPVALKSAADRLTELRRLTGKRARKALTSGGLEPVSDGGGDGHSVFTRAFLDTLRENREAMDGYQLYGKLRPKVIKNAAQTPAYSDIRFAGDEDGDFIFLPTRVSITTTRRGTPPQTPAVTMTDKETVFWQSIEGSGSAAGYQAYLRQYPSGAFAELAKVRIQTLTKATPEAEKTRPLSAETLEVGFDRPGSDITSFESSSPEACSAACREDGRCRAFTYVKPGIQGPAAKCWLKNAAPTKTPNGCCTSGIVRSALAQAPSAVASGIYKSTYGDITFTRRSDASVRGTYPTDSGRIIGTISGNMLVGYWVEENAAQRCEQNRDGSPYWGRIRYQFTDDGRAFTGIWGYCKAEPHRGWNGTRAEPD